MGYLLKEALKTLCGVNQWSYAVLWKIGFQNPKLLIWEECYCEPISYSHLPKITGVVKPELGFDDWDTWVLAEAGISHFPVPAGKKIHFLVNKMMMENHVNVVGEGLVGRAAFTGNHQWILSERYTGESHSQEVQKEVCQQFLAGIQTVSVIPVLPHGVVQLGSCFPIMENLAFVTDVKSLVQHLGCVPGVLLSDSYTTEEPVSKNGLPVNPGNGILVNTNNSTLFTESGNYQMNSNPAAGLVFQTSCSSAEPIHDNMKSRETTLKASKRAEDLGKSNNEYCQAKVIASTKPNLLSTGQLLNGMTKDRMINSNPDIWLEQASSNHASSTYQQHSSISSLPASSESLRQLEQRFLSDAGLQIHSDPYFNRSAGPMISGLCSNTRAIASSFGQSVMKPSEEVGELFKEVNSNVKIIADLESSQAATRSFKKSIPSMNPSESGFQNASSPRTEMSVPCMTDNLANHLPSDHCSTEYTPVKGELMKEKAEDELLQAVSIPLCKDDELSNLSEHIPAISPHDGILFAQGTPETNSQYEDGCMQPLSGDDLFDVFCVDFKNKLLNGSWSNYASDQMQGESLGPSKTFLTAGSLGSCSFGSGSSKINGRTYSQSSSMYGSQISSLVEQSQETKQSSSASTAYFKKVDEASKMNRKRLKPRENPKPRPKDRQMIQDRVKELREIVPNGVKCSIDALLERTIKHMLFLQSVTEHADKLKQTGESKILSKEGGLLLKDNYEGGATWAYEIGSQSMVCPIIVEDLNHPGQMLVEILCEEQGLFLEIADIIRGLGLTILKGVMETRNEKIWSCFAVEANRDVTRMEIFISLVHLLEQTVKSSVPASGIASDAVMVH